MRSTCVVSTLLLSHVAAWTTLSQTRYGAQIADLQALQHGTLNVNNMEAPLPPANELYYRVRCISQQAHCAARAAAAPTNPSTTRVRTPA